MFFIPQVWDSISDIKLIRSKKTPFIRRRSCFFFFSGGWSSWIWQHKCHVAALKLTWVSKTYHCYKASLASSYIQLTKFWSLEIFIDFPISPNLTNELLMKGQQKSWTFSCFTGTWLEITTTWQTSPLFCILMSLNMILGPSNERFVSTRIKFCGTVWRLDWWWTM